MKKKTTRQKREKSPFISEENKMDPEMTSKFKNYKGQPKPVIEMIEKEIMPLHIFVGPFVSNLDESSDENLNLMLTILHIKKNDTLQIRGRMRYDSTGRKTIFTLPMVYNLDQIEEAKEVILDFYQGIERELPFTPTKEPDMIDFEVNQTAKSVIRKLNSSNLFDIGTIEKK